MYSICCKAGVVTGTAGGDAGAATLAAAGTTELAGVSAPQATNAASAVTHTADMNQVCILIYFLSILISRKNWSGISVFATKNPTPIEEVGNL